LALVQMSQVDQRYRAVLAVEAGDRVGEVPTTEFPTRPVGLSAVGTVSIVLHNLNPLIERLADYYRARPKQRKRAAFRSTVVLVPTVCYVMGILLGMPVAAVAGTILVSTMFATSDRRPGGQVRRPPHEGTRLLGPTSTEGATSRSNDLDQLSKISCDGSDRYQDVRDTPPSADEVERDRPATLIRRPRNIESNTPALGLNV
jgi:hypothetical protein